MADAETKGSEEYEIIPLSPIRKLEKRLDQIEEGATGGGSPAKFMEEIIDVVRSNQRIVDDLVKSNIDLRNEMSRVPGKIDELLGTLREFMELLKVASQEETISGISSDVMKPLADGLNKLVEYNKRVVDSNQAMLAALDTIDKRLKRLYIVPPTRPTMPLIRKQ